MRLPASSEKESSLQKVIDELDRAAVETIQHGSFIKACKTAGHFADVVINLANAVDGNKSANR